MSNSTFQEGQSTFPLKPYSQTELSKIYGVDIRTFKKWLVPYEAEIGKRIGRYYSIFQVKLIFDRLGLPSMLNAA